MADLTVTATPIPGLLLLALPVHGDNRGWFKENWQRAKMTALGLPDFGPVQNNVSYNASVGATRGFHAEPWDKYVSVAAGKIFGAWVDLREGPTFGTVFTTVMGPDAAVFVPRGVGNAFQTLEQGTVYSYLVNEHWSAEAKADYLFVNLADEQLAVDWPLPLVDAEMSQADRDHRRLAEVRPMPAKPVVIVGGNGQVGRALRRRLPGAVATDRSTLDLTDPDSVAAYPWREVGAIVNAAAWTAVDAAETPDGRRDCWRANVDGIAALVRVAAEHRLPLVHLSSDYVFDGTAEWHTEDEPLSPLGVYGQTKAAGDVLVGTLPEHWVLRTSWVIGDGGNFVRTMASLADRGVAPSVVDDQWGRLTFADDLARAVEHLLTTRPAPGVYNVSCDGPVQSWAEIAAAVYAARGKDPAVITPVSTETYGAGKALAPRPRHSALDLTKIIASGFAPADGPAALADYLAALD
ncbi:dTDP-4-dehydrorhamnose 3,5-epimerase [Friedmanniella endophytica]|uniref:dTDP-4-dehydrorhamnose reductase n=1 Tax=Microlunatus kandeliicorticis TaxID=1759536 RepID=A0A7W3P4F0_9ACTN|nr:sugar nucleotide-binding protein [Microlunatus kandeliicorticis]MBA8792807.1 dTDP-4-dehydrorhamnose 3,5-epimerase [Microlunatus kandeliicorticis]